MNQYVPDLSSGSMEDAFAPFNGGGGDDGLIELMWCNGHAVMQSQAPRKPPRPEKAVVRERDDEAAAWFQYPVAVEDSLERDLFSEVFGEAQAAGAGRACKDKEEQCVGGARASPQSGLMPPPRPREKAFLGDVSDGAECTATATGNGESSMLTIGSSFCRSNHAQTPRARAPGDGAGTAGEAGSKARDAATVTASSSMRPRSCTTKAGPPGATVLRSGKRKQSDADTETEDAEFESADETCKPPRRKLTAAKRRRAAEVHNLSERRRRDRINEKMKALQELIPHCNKTDKASMLDEAIEYLKSLQLQLQMMWMTGGVAAATAAAPVMFPPGVHQYMQRMVGAPHVASVPFMAPPAVQSPPEVDVRAPPTATAAPHDHGLLAAAAAAEPGAAATGGDCTDVAFLRHPAQTIRKLWQV